MARLIGFLVLGLVGSVYACGSDEPARSTTSDGGGGQGGSAGGTTGGSTSNAGSDSGGQAGATGSAGAAGEAAFVPPTKLSETGLYSDIPSETLGEGVLEYSPQFHLWSDGADKYRFVYLPPDSTIDTSTMDYWVYPVGTKLWKEFNRDGVRVETRLLQKVAEGEWFMMAFKWNDDLTDADAAPSGEVDARGTDHNIPSQDDCRRCHEKMPDTLLGFTAIQLSHDQGGVTLDDLIADGRLSDPPAAPFVVPGTATDQAALGYLHANCGHCHNPESSVQLTVDMELWLSTTALDSVEETRTYLTTVDVNAQSSKSPSTAVRIVPMDVAGSLLHIRMTETNTDLHMPPLATEITDESGGVAALEAWIDTL